MATFTKSKKAPVLTGKFDSEKQSFSGRKVGYFLNRLEKGKPSNINLYAIQQ